MAHKNLTLDEAIDVVTAKYARYMSNVQQAGEDGRISEHYTQERIARLEQELENRIAYMSGQPRPRQREQQPLDDPDAGKVG